MVQVSYWLLGLVLVLWQAVVVLKGVFITIQAVQLHIHTKQTGMNIQ